MTSCSAAPEDDEKLYCEQCRSFFITKCEVHGPALFAPDTPAPMGVPDRARKTLPPGLEVRQSDLPGAGLGVFFNGRTVPVGAHFGPYEGELVDKEEAMKSRYSWMIYKSGQREDYIDAKSETQANWMRYVNCARNEEEQNLVAFQHRGEIFYRCCRLIKPGQELLVWYEDDYAKRLDVTFDKLWERKCFAKENNNVVSELVSCSLCLLSCPSTTYLRRHIKGRHPEEFEKHRPDKVINKNDISNGGSDSQTTSPRPAQIENSDGKIENDPNPDCGKILTNQNGKGQHKCLDCGKSFKRRCSFLEHRNFHSGERPYLCSQCGKGFKSSKNLWSHQLIHSEEKPYQCSQCGKTFKRQPSLVNHQTIHTGEKPYHCSECGTSFRKACSLKQHQLIHTGETPHRCSECGRSFRHYNSLQRHKQTHSGKGRFKCADCGKNFFDRYGFVEHRRVHTGERPHVCSQCGKSFNHLGALRMHRRIHTGLKPYHCSECDKCFQTAPCLLSHQLIHSGEKPYQCSQCDMTFRKTYHLKRHEHVHTGEKPYKCLQCGNGFRDRGTLRKHERIHTGEKPYPCSECGKSFSRRYLLKEHQLIHTGEKPHKCLKCGKEFRNGRTLRKHECTHSM